MAIMISALIFFNLCRRAPPGYTCLGNARPYFEMTRMDEGQRTLHTFEMNRERNAHLRVFPPMEFKKHQNTVSDAPAL